jgi:hypothetical protein
MNAVPEFESIPTRISLANNFKTTITWQSDALFLGALLASFVLMPSTAILVVWLIGRIGIHYLRSLKKSDSQ